MSELIHNFHFIRPAWLGLILPLIIGCVWFLKQAKPISEWQSVCDPELLSYLLTNPAQRSQRVVHYGIIFCALLGILAMAGPAWKKIPAPTYEEQSALVIVLDVSLSMNAQDIKPSRMARAKLKLRDILARRQSGQTALIVFAADAFTVSPLTTDTKTIENLIPHIDTQVVPVQGSNTDRAIQKAITLLDNARAQGDILIITDELNPSQAMLNKLLEKGIKVSVLGIGTPTGAPIPTQNGYLKDAQGNMVIAKRDDQALASLATDTQGVYRSITQDDQDIQAVILPHTFDKEVKKTQQKVDKWQEQGPWLLLPILLFSGLIFRRGYAFALTGLFIALNVGTPNIANANPFLTQDQQGAEFFADKDYAQAEKHFTQKQWQAAAQYRNKNYEGVVETLKDINTANAHYNRGNALTQLKQYDDAIKAYDQALSIQTSFPDAEHNKRVAQALQKKAQQQNKPKNNNSSKQNQHSKPSQRRESSSNKQQNQSSSRPPQEQSKPNGNNQQPDEKPRNEATNKNKQEQNQTNAQEMTKDSSIKHPKDTVKQPKALSKEEREIKRSTEQWLRQIPQAPNFLRNKFANEQQRKQASSEQNESNRNTQPW